MEEIGIIYKKLRAMELTAMTIAHKYFKNDIDKGGHPYMMHLENVAHGTSKFEEQEGIDHLIPSERSIFYCRCFIVAMLHDLIEDKTVTFAELPEMGIDDEQVIEALKSVTHLNRSERYLDFVNRAYLNDIGRIVKICDIEDNMDIRRLPSFGPEDQHRIKKYWHAWKFLKGDITFEQAEQGIYSK